jgi:two-component system chemotaxis response regulator CheB
MNVPDSHSPAAAVVIGASVGAIEALLTLLPTLPAQYPFAVLVVVHLPPDRRSALVELFAPRCKITVKEADDKEVLCAGTLYFAPSDYHLLVEPDFTLSLSNDEPVHFSRPAIDVLFQSAADAFGSDLTGVILTGASSDGALGLQAVSANGGCALVQDPSTAEGETMPLAAIAACPSAHVLTLEEIANFLNSESMSTPR